MGSVTGKATRMALTSFSAEMIRGSRARIAFTDGCSASTGFSRRILILKPEPLIYVLAPFIEVRSAGSSVEVGKVWRIFR